MGVRCRKSINLGTSVILEQADRHPAQNPAVAYADIKQVERCAG